MTCQVMAEVRPWVVSVHRVRAGLVSGRLSAAACIVESHLIGTWSAVAIFGRNAIAIATTPAWLESS